jgi:hypothetical protein
MCIAPKAPKLPPPPPTPEAPPPPPPPPPPAPTSVTPASTGTTPTTVRPSESARASSQRAASRGPGMLRIPTANVPVNVSASAGGGTSGRSINLNIGK